MTSLRPHPVGIYAVLPTSSYEVAHTSDVHDYNDEETDFRITPASRTSLAYQEPHSGRQDPRSASIPRHFEGETIDTEEIPRRIRPEPLLLHFSFTGPVPLPIAAPGFAHDG